MELQMVQKLQGGDHSRLLVAMDSGEDSDPVGRRGGGIGPAVSREMSLPGHIAHMAGIDGSAAARKLVPVAEDRRGTMANALIEGIRPGFTSCRRNRY
jgi:hypothetical protein